MTSKKYILLLLAVLSLTIISWDYTCGHTLDQLAAREYCPLCDTFKSAKIIILVLFVVIFLGIIPSVLCLIRDIIQFVPPLHHATVIPDRAPPVTI